MTDRIIVIRGYSIYLLKKIYLINFSIRWTELPGLSISKNHITIN